MITSQELVALAIEHMRAGGDVREGQTGDTALAKALNLGVHGAAVVKSWRKEQNAPNYASTIALLRLVGALNEEALQPVPEELRRRAMAQQERVRQIREELGREAGE